jgi:hypothetical protein
VSTYAVDASAFLAAVHRDLDLGVRVEAIR